MSNPLMTAMGGAPMPGPMGNMSQMMQAFQQFRSQFTGDPKQAVQQMLNSGKISQEQFNKAQQMARQFQQFLK